MLNSKIFIALACFALIVDLISFAILKDNKRREEAAIKAYKQKQKKELKQSMNTLDYNNSYYEYTCSHCGHIQTLITSKNIDLHIFPTCLKCGHLTNKISKTIPTEYKD